MNKANQQEAGAAFAGAFEQIFVVALRRLLEEHRAAVRLDVRTILGEVGVSAMTEPAALDSRGAARYLGVSTRTIARMRKDGRLPHSTVGHQIRYRREDLDELLADGKREAL